MQRGPLRPDGGRCSTAWTSSSTCAGASCARGAGDDWHDGWEQRIRERCLEYFRELDGIIARDRAAMAGPDAAVVFASDHGFGPPDRDVLRQRLAGARGLPRLGGRRRPAREPRRRRSGWGSSRDTTTCWTGRRRARTRRRRAATASTSCRRARSTRSGVPRRASTGSSATGSPTELRAVADRATGQRHRGARVHARRGVRGPYKPTGAGPDAGAATTAGSSRSSASDVAYRSRSVPSGTHRRRRDLHGPRARARARRANCTALSILDVAPLAAAQPGPGGARRTWKVGRPWPRSSPAWLREHPIRKGAAARRGSRAGGAGGRGGRARRVALHLGRRAEAGASGFAISATSNNDTRRVLLDPVPRGNDRGGHDR